MSLAKNDFESIISGLPPATQEAIRKLRNIRKTPSVTVSARLTDEDADFYTTLLKETGLGSSEILKKGLRALKFLKLLSEFSTKIKLEDLDGREQDVTALLAEFTIKSKESSNTPNSEPT